MGRKTFRLKSVELKCIDREGEPGTYRVLELWNQYDENDNSEGHFYETHQFKTLDAALEYRATLEYYDVDIAKAVVGESKDE